MKIKTILAGLVLTIISSHAAAALVSPVFSQLPQPLQNCTDCLLPYNGYQQFSGFSPGDQVPYTVANSTATTSSVFGYRYYDPNATSNEESHRWLIQYELFAPSGQSYLNRDPGLASSNTTYSNYAWLDVPAGLDPAESLHRFTLYTGQVTSSEPVFSGTYDPANTQTMQMTTIDAMAGSGFFHAGLYPEPNAGDLQPGIDLSPGYGIIEADYLLNLVYLDYSSGPLAFDFNDTRSLLYTRSEDLPNSGGFLLTQNFSVQATVPLPAAFWLMLGGVGVLGYTARRRKADAQGMA